MRTQKHYEKMLAENPGAAIGFSLAADMVYAARNGSIDPTEARGREEWRTIARTLKTRYGETLTVKQVRDEMSPAKIGAAALGSIKSERKSAAARENGRKGGRPRKPTP